MWSPEKRSGSMYGAVYIAPFDDWFNSRPGSETLSARCSAPARSGHAQVRPETLAGKRDQIEVGPQHVAARLGELRSTAGHASLHRFDERIAEALVHRVHEQP